MLSLPLLTMSHLHRKALLITIRKLCKSHDDKCDDDDDDGLALPPLPLPPPPQLESHSTPPLKVLLICTLAATFSFICYIILIKACRRVLQTRRRTRINRHVNRNETTRQDFIHEDHDHEPVVFHPVWLINTVGLDQSVIDSIQMFKYRKEDGLLIDSDCSVCLGVFEEDESLRLLPKCSHAFHVACIDTWLRSHKNCPLCRAPVVNNTSINQTDRNLVESSALEEIPSAGHEDRTTGVENAQEINTNHGVRVQSDLTNHCHPKLEPVRRSVSMGSFRFADQELVASQNLNVVQKSGKRRDSSSSTIDKGRTLRSGQEPV